MTDGFFATVHYDATIFQCLPLCFFRRRNPVAFLPGHPPSGKNRGVPQPVEYPPLCSMHTVPDAGSPPLRSARILKSESC